MPDYNHDMPIRKQFYEITTVEDMLCLEGRKLLLTPAHANGLESSVNNYYHVMLKWQKFIEIRH